MKYKITILKVVEVEASTMIEAVEKVRDGGKYKGGTIHSINEINNDSVKALKENIIKEVNKEYGLMGETDKI